MTPRSHGLLLALALCALLGACAGDPAVAAGQSGSPAADDYTLVGPASYLTGYPAVNADGTVNVVVEIPAGSNQKWEVDKADGALRWELRAGRPRVVAYLGYPGNYGMVPRTLLPSEGGGDGDPLDVLVIGAPAGRGEVLRCRVIGVLGLFDGGETDDKLLAVAEGNAFSDLADLAELERRFPGVREIVETWFVNYKGPGEMRSGGWRGAEAAQAVLEAAVEAFGEGPAGA